MLVLTFGGKLDATGSNNAIQKSQASTILSIICEGCNSPTACHTLLGIA